MALQIQKEFFSNPECMEFHVNVEISQSVIQSFYRPLRPTSDTYLKEVGEKGAKLVTRVMAIPGVTKATIEPYSLFLSKDSSLFQWKEIEPSVEKALGVIFGGEKEEVKYLSLSGIPVRILLREALGRSLILARGLWDCLLGKARRLKKIFRK